MSTNSRLAGLAAATALVPLLSGCIHEWEAQARIDPRTIAYYPGLEPSGAKEGCGSPALENDFHAGVVRLACKDGSTREETRSAASDEDSSVAMLPADPKDPLAGKIDRPPAPSSPKPAPQGPMELYAAASNGDAPARNRLASMLIKQSDDVCVAELGNLTAREAMVKTGLGTLTSLLSSISSFATGDRTKTLFSTGATFSNATRDHIESQVYRNLMSTAIIQSIDEDRASTRTALTGKFQDSTNDYSVDQMVMEVNRYHQSCSFFHGIGLVLKKLNQDNAGSGLSKLQALNYAIAGLDTEISGQQTKLSTLEGEAKEAQNKALADLIAKRNQLVLDRAALGTGPVSNSAPQPSTDGPKPEPTDPPIEGGNDVGGGEL